MSTLIEKLTKKQEAMIPKYYEEFLKIGTSVGRCDREKAEAAVKASSKYLKLNENPEIFWAESPAKGAVLAAQIAKGSLNVTAKEVREQASTASYGSFDAYWVSFYCFIAEQLPVKKDELAGIVRDIVSSCGVYWTFENTVVLTEKPKAIHMVGKKLHNKSGLALEYFDGTGICSIEGIRSKSLLEVAIQNKLK